MSYLNLILSVLGVFGFIAAYIGHLRGIIKDHENTIAGMQTDSRQSEFTRQINEGMKNITETERDYEKSRDDFKSKYPDSK